MHAVPLFHMFNFSLNLGLHVLTLGSAVDPADQTYQNQMIPPLENIIYSAGCAIPFYFEQLENENENGFFLHTEHLKSAQKLVQRVSVHSGPNWNLAVLVFEKEGKTGILGEKLLGARREPTTNSTHT